MVKEESSLGSKSRKKMTAKEREELLIENFVGLQKAMTHLSMRFESLSDNISKLINIFELSARDYLSKGKTTPEVDKDLLNKINSLLEQNKTIAKGLVMIEEKVRNKTGEVETSPQQMQQPQVPPRQNSQYQFKPRQLPGI